MTKKRYTYEFGKHMVLEYNFYDGLEKLTPSEVVDLLNENEQLKQVLGSILIEVRKDISATNHSSEVKAFVNLNSFDLISNVLKKYGALKDWYE